MARARVKTSGYEIGEIRPFPSLTTPGGWLSLATSGTIGSAASGATVLANDSAQALFTFLWNNYSNTDLPIQTSTGSPTARTTAAADWTANKRMPLPAMSGRTLVGAGTYTDPVSGTITRTLGNSIGAEKQPSTVAVSVPAHKHSKGNLGVSYSLYGRNDGGAAGAHTGLIGGDMNVGINVNYGNTNDVTGALSVSLSGIVGNTGGSDGDAAFSANVTNGNHDNMQPSHVTNFMIRYL